MIPFFNRKASTYRIVIVMAFFALALLFSSGMASAHTIPTISIVDVVTDNTVTIDEHNYPPNQTFSVTMGAMFTRGVDGDVIENVTTDAAGNLSNKTYVIPAALHGSHKISIRLQTAHAHPYYSFNYFVNNATAAPTTGTGGHGHANIPTFTVCQVNKGVDVRIVPHNLPADQTFNITMGKMWTRGVHGIDVGTTMTTNADGTPDITTFTIPADLAGDYRIAIRAQTSHAHPYYAFNWFYNNTASVC